MSYTAPPTFVASDVLAAADLNILGDDIAYLYSVSQGLTLSGCKVKRTSDQSIPDSTDTDVTWVTEVFDYGSWWSTGATVTVPAGAIPSGYTTIAVMMIARLKFASNGTGVRRVTILQNGSTVETRTIGGLSGDPTTADLVEVFTVAAGDTIKVQAYQTSGGALNLSSASAILLRYAPAS